MYDSHRVIDATDSGYYWTRQSAKKTAGNTCCLNEDIWLTGLLAEELSCGFTAGEVNVLGRICGPLR
jgi:hypothetical protein